MAGKINDYSGFNTIFRDTAIGLVLSAGGISTLLPNVIEGYSETRNLGSYEALNSFSVVYFLVPILICTCYWMLRGHKLYILEKFNEKERVELDTYDNREKMSNTTLFIYGVSIIKVIPIVVFLIDASVLVKIPWWFIGCWYIGISFIELLLAGESNEQFLESKLKDEKQSERYHDMLNRGFTIHALIFSLDLFLGLALIIFVGPWVLYSNSFYLMFAIAVGIYSVTYLILIYAKVRLKFHETRWRVAPVLFCFLFIGTTVPSVNLKNFSIVTIICFAVSIAILIASYKLEDRKLMKKRAEAEPALPPEGDEVVKTRNNSNRHFTWYTVVIMALGAGVVCCVIRPMYQKLNSEYFYARLNASQSFSNNEKFPLSLVAVEANRDTLKKENLMTAMKNLHNMNVNMAFELKQAGFLNELLQQLVLKPDSLKGIRELYYKKYQLLVQRTRARDTVHYERNLKSFSLDPKSLNAFYEGINSYVDDQVFPNYIDKAHDLKLNEELDYLRHYEHPLDYYSFIFDEYVKQKDSAKVMLGLAEKINDNQKFLDASKPKAGDTKQAVMTNEMVSSIPIHQARLILQLRKMYKDHWELQPIVDQIDLLVEKGGTPWLVSFHSKYLEYKEHMYADRYKKAQVIYRSYLLDSQRIGVYFFVASLAVITLALAFNYKDQRKFFLTAKSDDDPYPLPPDMPAKSLFIQALALTVLLIPLLKPIKPSNIDPEKPYWMLNIQNWNTPVFTAKLTKPDSDPKPSTVFVEPTDVAPIVNQLKALEIPLVQRLDSVNSAVRDQSTYQNSKNNQP